MPRARGNISQFRKIPHLAVELKKNESRDNCGAIEAGCDCYNFNSVKEHQHHSVHVTSFRMQLKINSSGFP